MTPEEQLEALRIARERGLLSQKQSAAVQELERRRGIGSGGQMNRRMQHEQQPWTLGRAFRSANLATMGVPVANDLAGLLDDSYMYLTNPESRTWGNAAMSAAGVVPFVPSAAGVVRGFGSKGEIFADQLSKYDDVLDADISANIDRATLNKIIVNKDSRGQGIGSEFMSDLTRIADEQAIPVQLSPTGDFGGSPKRLRDFYKRFGFVENKGANRDFEISETMYRNRSGLGSDVSYRGHHTAPGRQGANSLDDMSDVYPDDIYDPSVAGNYYGHGGDSRVMDSESARIISQFAGNPDAEVTIYRAVPKGVKDINPGDWITINKNYAASHGNSWVEDGQYDIISKKVKAKDVVTDGNSIHEFGYAPFE